MSAKNEPKTLNQAQSREMDLLRVFSRAKFTNRIVRGMHLKWNTSSLPVVWNSLWDLPICNTLLLWFASAFFLGTVLNTSEISIKIKDAQPASIPEISHLLETGKVESECTVNFVKQGTR